MVKKSTKVVKSAGRDLSRGKENASSNRDDKFIGYQINKAKPKPQNTSKSPKSDKK